MKITPQISPYHCIECGMPRKHRGPERPEVYVSDTRLLCDACFELRELQAQQRHDAEASRRTHRADPLDTFD